MAGGSVIGWILLLSMVGLLVAVGWWQWKAYVTLDRRIEQGDETLLHSARLGLKSTRIETVLDAPLGSVVVPYVPAQLVPAVQQPPNQPPPY